MSKPRTFGSRKRLVQHELCSSLAKTGRYKEGIVYALSGAKPNEFLDIFSKYKLGSEYWLFEEDLELIPHVLKELKNSSVQLFPFSIFSSLIRKQMVSISGLDLDFCQSLSNSLSVTLGLYLVDMLNSCTSNELWLRIGTSIAFDAGRKEIEERLSNLINYLSNNTKFEMFNPVIKTYCDSRTMLIWQIELRRKDTMKKSKEKTYNMLNDNQRGMVQVLCEANFPSEVIADQFNIRKTTVSAVKANLHPNRIH